MGLPRVVLATQGSTRGNPGLCYLHRFAVLLGVLCRREIDLCRRSSEPASRNAQTTESRRPHHPPAHRHDHRRTSPLVSPHAGSPDPGPAAGRGLLWLSERFHWFPFNAHKGWTVLIAVASLGVFLLLMLLWFLAALVLRLRFQFSIRVVVGPDRRRRPPV